MLQGLRMKIFTFRFSEDSNFLSRLDGSLQAEDPQLVSYVFSHYLKPPSTLPYNFRLRPSDEDDRPFLREYFFNTIVYETFRNSSESGFFIEAGALDGEIASNTLWLEFKKNWTGLLIEPNQASCKILNTKHRKAWTSCSCITPKKYAERTIFEIPDAHDDYYFSLWLYRANVRSINSRFHTYEDIIKDKASFTYSSVQCFPLITYLLALNITVVDLLSLDTQGGEKTMLMSFPFDTVKVKYMLIEYFKKGPHPTQKDEEFVSYLNSKGFDLLNMSYFGEYVFLNRWFYTPETSKNMSYL